MRRRARRPTPRPRSRRSPPPTARRRRRRPAAAPEPNSRSVVGNQDTDKSMARVSGTANRTSVVVLTADPAFEQSLRATFGASGQIELRLVSGSLSTAADFAPGDATVVIIDLDASRAEEMQALERLMLRTGIPPVVVVAQSFDADVAR